MVNIGNVDSFRHRADLRPRTREIMDDENEVRMSEQRNSVLNDEPVPITMNEENLNQRSVSSSVGNSRRPSRQPIPPSRFADYIAWDEIDELDSSESGGDV